MTVKKLVAIFLLVTLLLTLSACGGGEGGGVFESLTEGSRESQSVESESEGGGISMGEDSDADKWGEFTPFN